MENRTVFAENLIRLRKKYGMTQADLSQASGVSRRSIALYETKPVNPPLDNIERLAHTLNVSIEELVGFQQEKSKTTQDFSNIDSRTLKKIKQILSLTPEQRHMVYSFIDSLSKKNQGKDSN